MATRFKTDGATTRGVDGLTGGRVRKSASADITIPAVGIDDVDRALFGLFDKEIGLQVVEGDESRKVPVIFAAGERWALQKRTKAFRDVNNSLILPLVTIVRTSIRQSVETDVTGRGTNQATGELIIKRKIDKSSDRALQSLTNRLFLRHQLNVAVDSTSADSDQPYTSRTIGSLTKDTIVQSGGLLVGDSTSNVTETLSVPQPQFCTAVYDITLWAQHVQHMNQMVERIVASMLPQAQSWKLDTPKGYWFIAHVDSDEFAADNNFDDMALTERTIKTKFTITVPMYVLAPDVPGGRVNVKRRVSSPDISFDVGTIDVGQLVTPDLLLGSDDPTLSLMTRHSDRRDKRDDGSDRLDRHGNETVNSTDPALKSVPRGTLGHRYKKFVYLNDKGERVVKYERVRVTNKYTGESTMSRFDLDGVLIAITDE